MSTLARLRIIAVVGGLLIAVAAGGFAGIALGERASRPDVVELVVPDPELIAGDGVSLRSPGGFTGFEGTPALSGRVVRVGTFEAAGPDEVRVVQDGATVEISLRDPARLLRLGPATAPLAPGHVVLVRYEGDAPVAVLRVPDDLHERDRPPPRRRPNGE